MDLELFVAFSLGMGLGISFDLGMKVPVRGDDMEDHLSKAEQEIEIVWKWLGEFSKVNGGNRNEHYESIQTDGIPEGERSQIYKEGGLIG